MRFLPHVESADYFDWGDHRVTASRITPLLGRTQVLKLQQLTKDEIILVLKRAPKTLNNQVGVAQSSRLSKQSWRTARARVARYLELALSFGESHPSVVKAAPAAITGL